jgi:hypothetical protein
MLYAGPVSWCLVGVGLSTRAVLSARRWRRCRRRGNGRACSGEATATIATVVISATTDARGRPIVVSFSPELLDDLDDFVGFVAVFAGVCDELSRVGDDGALFRGAGNGDAASAAELEQAFVS